MSVGVGGLWELGWSAPISEADLWRYPARDFAVDRWCMSPVSGIFNKHVVEYEHVEDLLEANRDLTIVFVDEHAEVELGDFEHPDDAFYMFGKANSTPYPHFARDGDLAVRFDTVSGTQGLVWPHQALAIVLYDREVKGRGNNGN